MISTATLTDVFVEVADTLVADFDLIDFLHNLTVHVAEICDVPAVGILLVDHHDQLQFMASSSQTAQVLELFQLQNQEGPCLDCFVSKQPVINTNLRGARERWPRFAPRAMADGFQSVHAIPMRLREQVIGTMNIFGADQARLDRADVQVVQALTDVATIAILQERSIARAETLTEQLQGALNSRIVIEQAKGALSRLRGISIDEAFWLMRDHARHHRLRVADVASSVLNQPETVAVLTA